MSDGLIAERSHFIVTGAASGIGAATVRRLVTSGADVLALDVKESALEMGDLGGPGRWSSRVCDVTDPAAVADAVEEAERQFGRLDGIFNNAGILGPTARLVDYSPTELARVLKVNVAGVFNGMRAALPALVRAGGGMVLNTASTGGLVGAPDQSGYVASKHAVVGLTRSVALEVAREGIAVNALCPGATDTAMMGEVAAGWESAGLLPASVLEAVTPTRRMAAPQEVASVAAWLLRSAPLYLTGSCIPIDGGQTAS